MDRTSIGTQTYIDDNNNLVELDTASIDNFYAPSAPQLPARGHHVVRLAHYEMVPAKTVTTKFDIYTTKPYVMLDLADQKSGEIINTRLYANFVPYFMDQLGIQTSGEISGMKLSAVLNYISRNDIEIWVEYSREFGVQVNYREPRK